METRVRVLRFKLFMETIESFETMGLTFLNGRIRLIQSSFIKER